VTKEIAPVHHADRRQDVVMPYAPGIVVRRGRLVFLSGVTAAPSITVIRIARRSSTCR
jgi:hypothetical protein